MGAKKDTGEMIRTQTAKLKEMEEEHSFMKEANTWFRKHGSLDGFEKAHRVPYWRTSWNGTNGRTGIRPPYSSAEIQASRAAIQRTKERLAFLRERREDEQRQERKEKRSKDGGPDMRLVRSGKEKEGKSRQAGEHRAAGTPAGDRPSIRMKLREKQEQVRRMEYAHEARTHEAPSAAMEK